MPGSARFNLGAQTPTRDEERVIADRLLGGALVIYPTDTLYAIGCCAVLGPAVGRLRAAKLREDGKPLPVIVSDAEQARSMVGAWPIDAQRLADVFWPGPLTLVLKAAAHLPAELLAGAAGIALRVPDSADARFLARLAGPLVATSANRAGEAPCATVEEAMAAFPQAELAFDAGPLQGAPSTLLELGESGRGARLLREGRIARADIEQAMGAEFFSA